MPRTGLTVINTAIDKVKDYNVLVTRQYFNLPVETRHQDLVATFEWYSREMAKTTHMMSVIDKALDEWDMKKRLTATTIRALQQIIEYTEQATTRY